MLARTAVQKTTSPPDGLLSVTLGADASAEDLVRELSQLVELTRRITSSEVFRYKIDLSRVIADGAFDACCCLMTFG